MKVYLRHCKHVDDSDIVIHGVTWLPPLSMKFFGDGNLVEKITRISMSSVLGDQFLPSSKVPDFIFLGKFLSSWNNIWTRLEVGTASSDRSTRDQVGKPVSLRVRFPWSIKFCIVVISHPCMVPVIIYQRLGIPRLKSTAELNLVR